MVLVLLVVTLAWKEDIAIAVAVLGIILAFRGERRIGLWTLGLAVVWFVVAYGIVMPHLNGGTNHAGTFYGELGDSPTDIARTMLTEPDVVIDRLTNNDALGYARDLLAPFGFLPLLSPLVLIGVPQFFANVLTNANFFWDIRFHYTSVIVAALALACVEGVARLHRTSWRRFAVGFTAACALATSVAWGISPIGTQYRTGYWPLQGNARQATLDAAVAAIPDDAAVSAPYHMVPHLSHRRRSTRSRTHGSPTTTASTAWPPTTGSRPHAEEIDWLIVDLRRSGRSPRGEAAGDPARARRVRGRQ